MPDKYEDQLDRVAEQYRGRRTVAASFVDEVVWLATAEREAAKARAEGADAAFETAKEGLLARIEALRSERDELQRQLQVVDDRSLIFGHTQKGSETVIVIPSRLQSGAAHAWEIQDLEEIAYRARLGGGSDRTPVDMDRQNCAVEVPLAPLIQLKDTSPLDDLQPQPVDSTQARVVLSQRDTIESLRRMCNQYRAFAVISIVALSVILAVAIIVG